MPRRSNQVDRREVLPDAKFNSRLVAKMINTLMKQGKKTTVYLI